jgi:very-short-patch-repair endonuclease
VAGRSPVVHLQRARELRLNTTGCERKLWSVLRTLRQSHGMHFRRQVPIGPFIADFACHKIRVIIEADGAHHQPISDAARDLWFKRAGYRTLRFSNWEIVNEWEGVVRTLEIELKLDGDSGG